MARLGLCRGEHDPAVIQLTGVKKGVRALQ